MAFSKILLPFLCALTLTTPALAQGRHTKGEKPLSIAQGQKVNLTDFFVPGRTTVFMFTSEYDPLCRSYNDPLYVLHRNVESLAIVKIDINRPEIHRIDWQSPVAQQYKIGSLPSFGIYSPEGKLQADGQRAIELVNEWIKRQN